MRSPEEFSFVSKSIFWIEGIIRNVIFMMEFKFNTSKENRYGRNEIGVRNICENGNEFMIQTKQKGEDERVLEEKLTISSELSSELSVGML